LKKTFVATVVPAGNATGVDVPVAVLDALAGGKRPLVSIEINGHAWRSRIMPKDGRLLIGISAANRAAAGIASGDKVKVTVALDNEPRDVEIPKDLIKALATRRGAREAFDRVPYGLRRKYVTDIENAKTAATRERRISKLIDTLST
jgi:hypothetical protein